MAAPSDITLKDLSGQWVMNKTLSDDTDAILIMQGVGWFMRKAIRFATITLSVKEYVDPETSVTHVDITNTATGGISSTTELRTLDWTFREHKDGIFGEVRGKSRFVKLDNLERGKEGDDWLKKGWEDENGEFIQSYVESVDNGWTADQVWGFEKVDDTRYYVRHVLVRKGDDWKQARLVYDFIKK